VNCAFYFQWVQLIRVLNKAFYFSVFAIKKLFNWNSEGLNDLSKIKKAPRFSGKHNLQGKQFNKIWDNQRGLVIIGCENLEQENYSYLFRKFITYFNISLHRLMKNKKMKFIYIFLEKKKNLEDWNVQRGKHLENEMRSRNFSTLLQFGEGWEWRCLLWNKHLRQLAKARNNCAQNNLVHKDFIKH